VACGVELNLQKATHNWMLERRISYNEAVELTAAATAA